MKAALWQGSELNAQVDHKDRKGYHNGIICYTLQVRVYLMSLVMPTWQKFGCVEEES